MVGRVPFIFMFRSMKGRKFGQGDQASRLVGVSKEMRVSSIQKNSYTLQSVVATHISRSMVHITSANEQISS